MEENMDKNYLGSNIPKLGFGLMRLPMNGEVVDLEQTKKMVDAFMAKGFTYFDTAYVYIGGTSEVMAKKAIVERYPRDSFQLATKLAMWEVKEEADMAKQLETSLTRAGVDYFDFYLMHRRRQSKTRWLLFPRYTRKARRSFNSSPGNGICSAADQLC